MMAIRCRITAKALHQKLDFGGRKDINRVALFCGECNRNWLIGKLRFIMAEQESSMAQLEFGAIIN
jgi:hypothetical protein